MVVDDLDILGACSGPAKADPVLVVDADRMLSGTVAFERLEPVARRDSQVVQPTGDLQLTQLAPRDLLDRLKTPDPAAMGEGLGIGIAERDDHGTMITRGVNNARRDDSCGALPSLLLALGD